MTLFSLKLTHYRQGRLCSDCGLWTQVGDIMLTGIK